MDYLRAIILGIVQGLTEFLPVSSSGHLQIFKNLFGARFFESGLTLDIMLHLGTLLSVFVVFRKDIFELIKEFFMLIADVFRGKFRIETPYRRMLLLLVVASIPAAFAGFLFKDFVESIAGDRLWVVGVCLFITASILLLSDKVVTGKKEMKDLSLRNSFFVGLFQGVAILPGISRSGSTIAGALFAGFSREFAVKFSFLLSIPAILGAALFDGIDVIKEGTDLSFLPAICGVAVAAVSGFFAIKILRKLVKDGKFKYFAYYCMVAGVLTLVLSFT